MIKVDGISKKFKLFRSPADRLREIVTGKKHHTDYVALDNISFEVAPGHTLGIIGQNGAGKSTLLKILSGIVIPDSGTIQIDGKVTGLLELGTGFNFEMTGLENISMNGMLLGMTREEIDQKKQTIIDFSELGEFIHEPIKTYSSGMVMRLAFSIAIHADPTCFLVDEALAVGDAYFQQKCMRKIQEFRENGGSIVFVSHDMNAIMCLTDSAIWLESGVVMMAGDVRRVVDSYWSKMIDRMDSSFTHNMVEENHLNTNKINSQKKSNEEINENIVTRTKGDIVCKGIIISNLLGEEICQAMSGETIKIEVVYFALKDIINPDYGIQIRNKNGIAVFGVNFAGKNLKETIHYKNCIKRICYRINLNLLPGEYFISLGVAANVVKTEACLFENYLFNAWDVKKIDIILNKNIPVYYGITNLENSIEVVND